MKSGIYKITNIVNNKVYVGRSVNWLKRISVHKSELRKNKHSNPYLQKAWNKYGETNFICELVEQCSVDELKDKEIYWIDKLNAINRDFGYNIREEENDGKCTEEYRKRIGKISKEKLTKYYKEIKQEGRLEVTTIHLETEERKTYSCKTDLPFNIKNKNFNFGEKLFYTNTYNKSEEQIEKEFLKVKNKYLNYLKSQESKPKVYKRKQEDYLHHACYATIFRSENQELHFKCNDDVAKYFDITPSHVSTILKNGVYTVSYFNLLKDNKIVSTASDLKTLAKLNNHNYKAYKKVRDKSKKHYKGFIIERVDTVYNVEKI